MSNLNPPDFPGKNNVHTMRDPVSGLTHLAAAVVSAVGTAALLIVGRGDLLREAALAIYGAGLMLLFSASAAYHLFSGRPETLLVLRKFDHSSIYVLIAASYTPLCVIAFHGFWRWGLLSIIWGLALAGILIKMFVIKGPRWLTAGVYLVMGWMAVLAVGEMAASLSPVSIGWLFAGGIFYTLGALIYITKKLDFKPGAFGFHEVWHIFVILGAGSHYISVLYMLMHG
jgi:hemolysin III